MSTAPTGGDSLQRVRAIYAAAARAGAAGAPHPLAERLYGQPDLPAAAGASLGCANPIALAGLQPGQTILDLGCGAGLDALLAARQVGPGGRVIGVDMTPEIITLARRHAAEAAVTNAEFRLGAMEDLPVQDSSMDVVISNCAGSLSPANDRLLAEALRVLVPGGRLAVADLALRGALPASVRDWLAAWGGITGALTVEAYHAAVTRAGFTGVTVQVLHTFGLADIEMVESTPLGGGLSGLPEADLRAADGIVASIHITAARPYGPAGASHD